MNSIKEETIQSMKERIDLCNKQIKEVEAEKKECEEFLALIKDAQDTINEK